MTILLESSLGILSTAPWFDEATATELLGLQSRTPLNEASEVLSRLDRAGMFVTRGSVRRVVEPLRSHLRRSLHGDDEELYTKAVAIFAEHAAADLKPQLMGVMGNHGSALNIAALTAFAHSEHTPSFDALVDLVQMPSDVDEAHKAATAARVYELYSFKRDRKSDFLRGLSLWAKGRHFEAEICFKTVLIGAKPDKARAIAAHLTGVSRHREGDLRESRRLLLQAIDDLRFLEDQPGLSVVLTTLGRVERDAYRETQKTESIVASISVLEEANNLNVRLGRVDGRNLVALSQSYFAAGRLEEALTIGEQAVSDSSSSGDAVSALCNLSVIRRESGDLPEATRLLDRASDMASRDGVKDQSLARLLNMLAANERRIGDLKGAKRHAQESLAMGRRVQDQRHIAHASHTLAGILMDSVQPAQSEQEQQDLLRAATTLLNESREILISLRNRPGIDMVEATLARLTAGGSDVSVVESLGEQGRDGSSAST